MLKFIIFIFIILILCMITRHYLRKKLGLEWMIPYKHVNKTHKILSIILPFVILAVFIVFLFVTEWYLKNQYLFLYFIFTMNTLMLLFQLFMEWKYDKASKRYLLSIHDFIYMALVLAGIFIFLPLK